MKADDSFTAPEGFKYVSCSKELSWDASRNRHLLRIGTVTTLCNATAVGARTWFGNGSKPVCERCVESARSKIPNPIAGQESRTR